MTVPRDRSGFSGMTGLVAGLMLGGLAAFFAYQKGKEVGAATAAELQPVKKPASVRAAEQDAASPSPPADTIDYTFYDRLRQQGVEVAGKESAPAAGDTPLDSEPGLYLVQVASLPRPADAEEVRAQLALQGLTARVAAVQVAGTTWHRVLIGPVSDTRTAEEVAVRLRGMKYTPVVSRMAD